MGKMIELTASDGHKLAAYRSDPAGAPKGAIVVIQEIFGVNNHIKRVTDNFVAKGYAAIAPVLFDRVKRGVELKYDAAGMEAGRNLRGQVGEAGPLKDIQAAIDAVKGVGKTATVGYCWGGTLAFLSATRLNGIVCSVGYYGGGIAAAANEKPKVPTMLHFGDKDQSIPMTDVEKVKQARTDCTIYVYPAGHGFNCDERSSHEPASAKLALDRTMSLIAEYVGK